MSKTDHARFSGTHRAGHDGRDERKYVMASRLAVMATAREEIAEGLALVAAPIDLDERFTVRECMDQFEALDEWDFEPETERMAEWEMALISGLDFPEPPEGTVWSVTTRYGDVDTDPWAVMAGTPDLWEATTTDEDLDSAEHPSAWLAVPPSEFFDAVGSAYVIEGPSGRDRSSGKAGAYMRAHELALLVGIDTARMIEHLREVEGEWVQSATAYVALPVCQRMIDLTADLRAEYGERCATQVSESALALADLRCRLS